MIDNKSCPPHLKEKGIINKNQETIIITAYQNADARRRVFIQSDVEIRLLLIGRLQEILE